MATQIIEFGNLKRRKLTDEQIQMSIASNYKLPPSPNVVAFQRACLNLRAQQLMVNGVGRETKFLMVKSSCFTAIKLPEISIEGYLNRIERYMPCSLQVFVYGYLLLECFSRRYPFGQLELHRVVFVALVIAHKIVEDDNIRPYSAIGGVSKKELLRLELAFLHTLDWDVFIDSEYVNWICKYFLK